MQQTKQPSKYLYIISRDGVIFEIPFTKQRLAYATKCMISKDIFTLKDFYEFGAVINGADISYVLNDEKYETYLAAKKPSLYIKDGIWRDGKTRDIVRIEKWKSLGIAKSADTISLDECVSAEEEQRVRDRIKQIRDFYNPQINPVA